MWTLCTAFERMFFALTCSLRIDKPTGLDHHIHAILFWVSKPKKFFETPNWLGCSLRGCFSPAQLVLASLFCCIQYIHASMLCMYMLCIYIYVLCICYIIHTESTVNGRSDSTISECWWLSPPLSGATDLDDTLRCPRTWQCQENLHWSYSHLETSMKLHLSSFIFHDFPICSMGFRMVFPWFSHL